MTYIDVKWIHDHPFEPIRLVSELNGFCFEVRKLEFFRDGRVGFASSTKASEKTRLGDAAVPPLAEINESAEFNGIEISAEEFAKLWNQYGSR